MSNRKVILKHSDIFNDIPLAEDLEFGELYVNCTSGNGNSFCVVRKSDDTLAIFNEKDYNDSKYAPIDYIDSALTQVNEEISLLSSITETLSASSYGDISELSASTVSFSASVIDTYATSSDTYNAVSGLSSLIDTFSASVTENYTTNSDFNEVIDGLSADTNESITELQNNVIDNELVISFALNDLNSKIEINYNNTINYVNEINSTLTDSIVNLSASTEDFIEYVYSNYATSSDTYNAINNLNDYTIDVVNDLNNSIDELSGSVIAFSSSVVNDYTTQEKSLELYDSAYTNAVVAASANMVNALSNYAEFGVINGQLQSLSSATEAFSAGVISTYATSADTYGAINGILSNVNELSASVITNYTTIDQSENLFESAYTNAVESASANMVSALGDYATSSDTYNAIMEVSSDVNELSASVVNNYTTIERSDILYESAYTNAVESASANMVNALSNYAEFGEINGQLQSLSSATEAFSAGVINTYATSADTYDAITGVSSSISELSSSVITNYTTIEQSDLLYESAYTNAVESASANMVSALSNYAEFGEINGQLQNLSSATQSFSSSVIDNYATSADTYDAITGISTNLNELSSSVITNYTTIDQSELLYESAYTNAIIAASANMVTALSGYTEFSETKALIEGLSAGVITNYATSADTYDAIMNANSDINIISGIVFDSYATKAEASEYAAIARDTAVSIASANMITALESYARFDEINGQLQNLSSTTQSFSAGVIANYATSADTYDAITGISTNLNELSSSVITNYTTIEQSDLLYESAYTNAIIAASANMVTALSGYAGFDEINELVHELSGGVIDNYATSSDTYDAITGAIYDINAISGIVFDSYATKAEASEYAAIARGTAVSIASANMVSALSSYAKFDEINGSIQELSGSVIDNYATSSDTYDAIIAITSGFAVFSASVINNYTTIGQSELLYESAYTNAIIAASANMETALSGYAGFDQINELINELSGGVIENYATSANTYNAIMDVRSEISSISGTVFDSYATKAEASEYASIAEINAIDVSSANTISALTNYSRKIEVTPSADKLFILGLTDSAATLSSSTVHTNENIYIEDNEIVTPSDETLKTFKEDVTVDFDSLKNIPKKYFEWINKPGERQIGTSAQILANYYPEIVHVDENGKYGVSYEKLSIIALAAIDILYDEIMYLKQILKNNGLN